MRTMAFFLFILTLISLFIFNAVEMKGSNERTLTPQEINELAMARADVLEAQAKRDIAQADSNEEIARISATKEATLAQLQKDEAVAIANADKESKLGVSEQNRLRAVEVANINADAETSQQWANAFGSVGAVVVNVVGGLIALLAFLYVFQDVLKKFFFHREKMAEIGNTFQLQQKQLSIVETGIQAFGTQGWTDITDYARRNGYQTQLKQGQLYLVSNDEEIELLPDD